MQNLFSVAGKTALVTGGSSGIGAMIARGLVENGVKTYIASRKPGPLTEMVEELSLYGSCLPIQADISSMEGIENLVRELSKTESSLDILVNNAGIAWGQSFEKFPERGWDPVMDINVKSIFFLTQKLFPLLKAAGTHEDPARVVNIASINGLVHSLMPNYSYSASKAAVIQLTRHLAADLAKNNVNINGIAPGYFPSKITAHLEGTDELEGAIASYPRGRGGQPTDIAGTVIYLCSLASSWVCGHTITLDGGVVAAAG